MSMLNRNVGSLLGKSTPSLVENVGDWVFNSNVGIEVEVENFDFSQDTSLRNWRVTSDSSLRNSGAELISEIISGRNVYRAIHDVSEHFSNHQPNAEFNARTSTHVHIDVTDLTVSELRNFCYLAIGVEPLLMLMVDSSRTNNNFCLEVRKASGVIPRIKRMLEAGNAEEFQAYSSSISPRNFKYAATNFANIYRLGTIEFRMHHGCADKLRLLRWVSLLCNLKDLAKEYDSIAAIRESKINNELAHHFTDRMAELGNVHLPMEDIAGILDESFEYANDIESAPRQINIGSMLSAFRITPEREPVQRATPEQQRVNDSLRNRLNSLRDNYNSLINS